MFHQSCVFILSHRGSCRTTCLTKDPFSGPYHKGERPGRQGSVVIDAVPHTHLNLSFLDSVARSVIQQTHNPVDAQGKGESEMSESSTVVQSFYFYVFITPDM